MSAQAPIPRKREDPDGLSFEALRRLGVELAQAFAGATWTDYNVHDPGVTFLEALCYGLTDAIYRSGFPCEDYLTDAEGVVDYAKLALFPPQDVFPSHPVAPADYCRLIFDAVPEVDDVWVEPLTGDSAGWPGLYAVLLRLGEARQGAPIADEDRERAVRAVRARFAARRALCEDLHEIAVGRPVYYRLKGRLEIDGARDPEEVLGDIYFLCSRRLASRIEVARWRDVLAGGEPLDRLFDGPLARHGAIEVGAAVGATIAELAGAIRGVAGVVDVAALEWLDENGARADSPAGDLAARRYPCLKFPENAGEILISVHKSAKAIAVSYESVRRRFEKRLFDYRAFRDGQQNVADYIQPPTGLYRGFKTYHSIQHHLPAVYGLGRFGLPASASPERKAQAKQLSAYLYVFEQFLANFQQQLEELPKLFSLDLEVSASYFSQFLSEAELPGIERLYAADAHTVEARLAEIAARHDPATDRRSRVLDHLLALYGEEYSQKSLRQFNYYYSEAELETWIVGNKLRFLEHVVDIGQTRGLAFDYLRESWNTSNISGLQKKLGILLGLHRFGQSRSLCAPLLERGLALYGEPDGKTRVRPLPKAAMKEGKGLPPDANGHADIADYRLAEAFPEFADGIEGSALRLGIDPGRYRIERRENGYVLGLAHGPDGTCDELGAFEDAGQAAVQAHALRAFLRHLNLECEGLHMVEHILLRPCRRPDAERENGNDAFYGLRLSVVFPNWTARFADREFQKLAEETVYLNCPAHVYAEIFWLDFGAMQAFEALYETWLDSKRADPPQGDELDAAAQALRDFLATRPPSESGMRWV